MNRRALLVIPAVLLVLILVAAIRSSGSSTLTQKEALGKLIYFDSNLSTPGGMSCATCHHPSAGFADPDRELPVSQGIVPTRFGNRNSPSAAYAAFSPSFHYDEEEGMYIGGQFWDGRAADLAEQAKGPFLNPLEMKNPSKKKVVQAVAKSSYAALFKEVYGPESLSDIDAAYDLIADAIAAYEASVEVNSFTSKYDYYRMGLVDLTEQEARGLALYNDPAKGNCAACHPSEPGPYAPQPLFTDYSYDNLGVPRNWDNPFLYLDPEFNPDGVDYIDYGLGGSLKSAGMPESVYGPEMGKVKVPTLRNIAVTRPYMHNGIFETLREVVDFYNTRDVGSWPPPEVPENVNSDELGNLGLTPQEVDDIVAFMETLTDGFVPPQ
jgi:cytochrome c peroxidase